MRKGFTLIELLVVISIIFLLSSIVLVAIKKSSNKADVIDTNIEEVEMVSKNTYDDSDTYDNGDSYESREPTVDEACGDIPNYDAEQDCRDSFLRERNIRECVERYTREDF